MQKKSIIFVIGLLVVAIIVVGFVVFYQLKSESKTLSENIVKTDSGVVKGKTKDGTHVFLGIPYAKPPVGNLRWKPPQPVKPWKNIFEAYEFGPACWQLKTRHPLGKMSEDCLHLNIWTPAKKADERLPVMVWIHGGGFVSESSSQPEFNGTNLG